MACCIQLPSTNLAGLAATSRHPNRGHKYASIRRDNAIKRLHISRKDTSSFLRKTLQSNCLHEIQVVPIPTLLKLKPGSVDLNNHVSIRSNKGHL